MLDRTTDRAKGKWFGILTGLGVSAKYLTGRHGPCPRCGGKDRFRWDNKEGDGTYFCTHCGAGSGMMLLMNLKGWDFKETADAVDQIVGKVRARPQKAPLTDEDKRAAMNRLWCKHAVPVTTTCPVGLYLARRCGLTKFPRCLRSAANVKYRADVWSYHPAMIAMITAPDGTPSMLHRTYLTPDGRRADLPEPRRMMPGSVAKGGAIRLAEATGEVLGVAEGIETALSVTALYGLPCWSAVNAALLAQWEPPAGPKRIIVFGDNDANYEGQRAAYYLAWRLMGNKEKYGYQVEVRIPERLKDWNDVATELASQQPHPQERT